MCVHKLRSPRGSKQSHISPDSGLKQLLFHAIITISHSLARSTLTTSGSTRGPQRTSLSARIFVAAHVLALPQHRVSILTNNDQNSVHVRPLARHSLAIKHPHWRTLRPVFCTQALQLCTWPPYPASCHSQAPATRFARRGASPGRTGIVCPTPVGKHPSCAGMRDTPASSAASPSFLTIYCSGDRGHPGCCQRWASAQGSIQW